MPQLPSINFSGISYIDAAIVAIFALQILWGAKLGFVPATFSLAGEILGIVVGILYANFLGQILDKQFHLINQLEHYLSQKINLPDQYLTNFSQTIYDAIVFLVLFLAVQIGFFYLGKFIHHQVGVRRVTYFSNHFFGMLIGAIKATLEVVFFLIAWNAITADPTIQASLQLINGLAHLTDHSLLLPIFQALVPPSSPLSKFF